MPSANGYYRHPTIHDDTVAFVTEDDLWTVSANGGLARRLTANPGSISFPCYSPDGRWIAFTGRDEGHPEVYVAEAEGGPPTRLTWLGATSQVVGWRPDGKEILFASDWRQAFPRVITLHSVRREGGSPAPLQLGPARAVSFEPQGAGMVIGRDSGDPARWKRYQGGTAGTLWVDRAGDGRFTPLIRLKGNLASPMWIGSRIYFLSDHEGYGNLYSCTATGRGLIRHTDHEDFYVRFPSSDGRRIVYHAGADLFVYDPGSGEERKIEIRLASARPQRNRRFVPAGRYLETFDLHPQGHSLASIHRGGLYTMPLWEGAPVRQEAASTARHRLATWLPDGRRLVAVTDEGGEEALAVIDTGGPAAPAETPPPARGRARKPAPRPEPRKRIEGDFGRAVLLSAAPAGPDRVALANQRQELMIVDLASARVRRIERSPFQRIAGLAWSPDGRWLAYGFHNSSRSCSLHLCEVESGKVTEITRPDFYDLNPSFDPEGKYLYFISFRVFDPVYDALYFDLGFPKGSRPYLLTLRKDVVSPFSPAQKPPRGPSGVVEARVLEAAKEKEEPKPAAVAVEIDLDGIADRIVPFPVPEGIYARVLGARGRVLFSSFPVEGSLETSWAGTAEPPAKGTLSVHSFEDEKTDLVTDRVSDFTLSMDARVLGIRSGNRIRVITSSARSDGKPVKDEPGRESGWVDLERLRVSVSPPAEWRQMFREAWRLQRDQFWTPDMSGHDWKGVHDRYLPLVDRVGSRSEFSDLLWEMQGELGTSHCYELGGDYRPEPAWLQGFLGADVVYEPRTRVWRIARIPRGDSWDEKRCSPLQAPGVNVAEGDEIVEVAGLPVGPDASPWERLANYSGREVVLRIRSRSRAMPAARGAKGRRAAAPRTEVPAVRTIAVKTLREEYSLRYRDWVESNRAWVHKQTNGRIGYVHVPNMGPLGYSEFHRYYSVEVQHQGLIVDVRFNGGGHVSQLLLEKLLRKRIGYDATRWGTPEPYPMDAPMGPLVAVTNEYAGSDGDIFSHSFKLYKLGPLLGKRTWGGVVGIWPRHSLVDGTLTTQPEFALWFVDVGWGVENHGTEPDIEVEIRPQDYAAGRDPQMERAVIEVEKLIRRMKPAVPELKDRPRLRPGRLPREK